ncbi:hypothetical protein L873DRAFT_1795916 [Choiromyces venosus 120613-1]|uniref:Uncharacterized protein n=1 Tax=Choiromyces venosus 120613-1 TaxID=1336337 RepID=A0A3N4IU81_9PEZI|nr:hypothetical protein L873DRAFT_1795916 [Choiromyces venosus 120613-1]
MRFLLLLIIRFLACSSIMTFLMTNRTVMRGAIGYKEKATKASGNQELRIKKHLLSSTFPNTLNLLFSTILPFLKIDNKKKWGRSCIIYKASEQKMSSKKKAWNTVKKGLNRVFQIDLEATQLKTK